MRRCFLKTLGMCLRCQLPVTMDFRLSARYNPGVLSGFQLLHPFKDAAAWRPSRPAEHQFGDPFAVDLGFYTGECQQRFNLGGK